jgi:hypothetical protein
MPRVDLCFNQSAWSRVGPVMVRTGGSPGRNDGSVETCLSDDINLNRWVSTRVVDRTSVNLGDRHFVVSST